MTRSAQILSALPGTATDIARRLDMDTWNVTATLNRLKAKGLAVNTGRRVKTAGQRAAGGFVWEKV